MVKRILGCVGLALLPAAMSPLACAPHATAPAAPGPVAANKNPSGRATAPGAASAASASSAAAPSAAASLAATPKFRDCGQDCKAFSAASDAFAYVLRENPRVLAIGEAHAQSEGPKVPSSTQRFMDSLLPALSPRASDLVIELWVASGACGKVEQQVQKQQTAVTAPQAATNQGDFMNLGFRAKALGITPHALVPSCEQYQKIAGAGAADIEEMLTMIKSVTLHDLEELNKARAPERLLVAYGGAMHNDVVPRPGREPFSFGPELSRETGERYVELDLVTPEQIKDTESWRALPWYPLYSSDKAGPEALLFSWAPHAYALVFPKADATAGLPP